MTTAIAEPMDITNVLNNRLSAMVHHPHFAQAYHDPHQQLSFVKPEPTMDRSHSPHGSEQAYMQHQGIPRTYQAHHPMQTQMHIPSSMAATNYMTAFNEMPNMMPNMAMGHMPQQMDAQQMQQDKPETAKPYSCSTCAKRFARRSDLSRHGMWSNSKCICNLIAQY